MLSPHAQTPVPEPRVHSIGLEAPGRAFIHSYRQQPLKPGQFRVITRYSGISTSEQAFISGGHPELNFGWDASTRTFGSADPGRHYPMLSLGHMEVGWVSASRSATVKEGQWVAMAYGHKTAHTVQAPEDFFVPLPDIDPVLGIFVAQVGPACAYRLLQAVGGSNTDSGHELYSRLVGREVCIVGSGVEALLCGLLARHFGAAQVQLEIKGQACRSAAHKLGLECSEEHLAAAEVYIDLRLNGSYLQATNLSPWSLGRNWNRGGLAQATLELLQLQEAELRRHLITHRIPFSQGTGFLQNLAASEEVVQAVLECSA